MVRAAWVRGRRLDSTDVIDARFGHVNLIARDWRALADWYSGCLAASSFRRSGITPARISRRAPACGTRPSAAPISGCPAMARAARRSRSTSSRRCRMGCRLPRTVRVPAHRVRRAVRRRCSVGRPRGRRRGRGIGGDAGDGRRTIRDVGLRDRSRRQHRRAPVLVRRAAGRGHRMTIPLRPGSCPARSAPSSSGSARAGPRTRCALRQGFGDFAGYPRPGR